MSRKHLTVVAVLAAEAFLTSCAAANPESGTPASTTGATSDEGHTGGHGHEAEELYGAPEVTWDATSQTSVEHTAETAMRLFARPEAPEAVWFSDLSPYLAADYADDARYIDPARIPVKTITDGPAISREAGNPMTVTASFSTDAGRWQIMLHRSGQQEPWLVTAISPEESS